MEDSYTPYGNGILTCPICGRYDEGPDGIDPTVCIGTEDFGLYCTYCNIIYDISECVHGVNGCTDDSYYGQLVSKWKYKDKIYDGMMKFDNVEECNNKIKDLYETFPVLCLICTNGMYPP